MDPHLGLQAIAEKRIAMTSPASFSDDPLRVLRAARFASVHGFAVDKAIYAKAKKVPLDELSAERVADELCRLLLESPRPALGLQEYLRLTVLAKLFPELAALALTIQDAHFHPEKDEQGHHSVWAHTLITVDIVQEAGRPVRAGRRALADPAAGRPAARLRQGRHHGLGIQARPHDRDLRLPRLARQQAGPRRCWSACASTRGRIFRCGNSS